MRRFDDDRAGHPRHVRVWATLDMTASRSRRLACAIAALAALLAAGCGANRDATTPGVHRTTSPPATAGEAPAAPSTSTGGPAPADQVRVIRRWADLLRQGHVTAASRLFSIPTVVANPGPRFQLGTRAEVKFFNRTLPCGGRLVDSELRGRYVIATFVLTERPGGSGCGTGVGARAQTAFLIRGHRIVEWLRVLDNESSDSSSS
jgi:hypothetical protein